jgi:hypothetical protein
MDTDTAVWARLTPAPRDLEAPIPIDELWRQAIKLLEVCSGQSRVIESLIGIDISKLPSGYERMSELTAVAAAVALQDCIEAEVLSLYVLNPGSNRFYRLPKDGLVSPMKGVSSYRGQDTGDRAAQTSEYSWATGVLHHTCCPDWLWPLAGHRLMTTRMDASATLNDLEISLAGALSVETRSRRSKADAIFDAEVWRDRSAWPRDDHPIRDPGTPAGVFIGRAIDDRLVRYAPSGAAGNAARLWAGELICKSARAGNIHTSLDGPTGKSLFAGTGDRAHDRARCESILADCGLRTRDGGWVPLFIVAADLDWLIGELEESVLVDAQRSGQTAVGHPGPEPVATDETPAARTQAAPMTPFEVEELQRETAAAKLAQRLPGDREWDLLVTLLWIGSRDFEWMAPHIVASQTVNRDVFDSVSSGGLVSWARTCLEQRPDMIESNPERRLVDRLTAGDIHASGLELGVGPRRDIPRKQWLDLHFSQPGRQEHDGLCCAYAGDPRDPRTHFWSRIAFDSASAMRAFRANMLVPAMVATHEPWRVEPGEAQCKWILRAAVRDEAERRWNGKSRASLARVFEDMAAPERSWKEANLLAAMKSSGQFPAPANLRSKT